MVDHEGVLLDCLDQPGIANCRVNGHEMGIALEEQRYGNPLHQVSVHRKLVLGQGEKEWIKVCFKLDSAQTKRPQQSVHHLDIVRTFDDDIAVLPRHGLPHIQSALTPHPEQEVSIDSLDPCFLLGLLQMKSH